MAKITKSVLTVLAVIGYVSLVDAVSNSNEESSKTIAYFVKTWCEKGCIGAGQTNEDCPEVDGLLRSKIEGLLCKLSLETCQLDKPGWKKFAESCFGSTNGTPTTGQPSGVSTPESTTESKMSTFAPSPASTSVTPGVATSVTPGVTSSSGTSSPTSASTSVTPGTSGPTSATTSVTSGTSIPTSLTTTVTSGTAVPTSGTTEGAGSTSAMPTTSGQTEVSPSFTTTIAAKSDANITDAASGNDQIVWISVLTVLAVLALIIGGIFLRRHLQKPGFGTAAKTSLGDGSTEKMGVGSDNA